MMMNNEMIANRYVLVQLIGEGGMASVYLAVDTILKREVAIKILRGDLAKDPVALLRFQREANATTKLAHPNIVEVYDVGEDQDRNYIVMEYVKGRSLKELIQKRGALPKEEAVNIMKQLVSAIAMAHQNGIIHRDIKSQNVLVKDDGTIKLSDFGIATAADAVQLTQTDVVIGSVHYLAPELARGESATQQSDIYSLGIVFYEMLTGDVPHHGDAPVQVALKHMREEIPSVKEFNPSLPQSIENIITKATVKNKTYRYQTADEMYDDLVTCLDVSRAKESKLVFEPEDVTKEVELSKQEKRKTMMMYSFIIVGILALAIFAVGFLIALNGGLSFGPKYVNVPDVSHLTVEQASELLEEKGLLVSTNYKYEITQDIEEGLVAYTTPKVGVEVEKGSTIVLTISEGTYYTLPDFTNWMIEDVEAELEKCCNVRILYDRVDDLEKTSGTVIGQSLPAGEMINPVRLQEITITITQNPEFMIPVDLIGKKVDEAVKILEKLGGKVKKVQEKVPTEKVCRLVDETDELGNVIGQKEECEYIEKEVTKGVVTRVDPDTGVFYTQTKKSYITIYYY
ncbi:MAG: protein kinase [Erysipelotrichaceae bacterium]|nr:protein kinase [Erysipelotrichaceae bacterium]